MNIEMVSYNYINHIVSDYTISHDSLVLEQGKKKYAAKIIIQMIYFQLALYVLLLGRKIRSLLICFVLIAA